MKREPSQVPGPHGYFKRQRLKRAQPPEGAESYALAIADIVREPLLILDATLRVRNANPAFYDFFRMADHETVGCSIYEIGPRLLDLPDLHHFLEEQMRETDRSTGFRLEHIFPTIGRRVLLINARKLNPGTFGELLIVAFEDVTGNPDLPVTA